MCGAATDRWQLTVRVRRFNPEVSQDSWWDEWTVHVDPLDRLVEVLHQIKWHHDGTLCFRRSCAHGICGSDAMLIDGRNQLACKVLAEDVGPKVTIEPIRGLSVLKDLIVDMDPFLEDYRVGAAVPDQRLGRAGQGAPAVAGGPASLRRHHQVHPVRRVHDLLPRLLGRRGVRRPRRHRERAPVHLRLPRRGRDASGMKILSEKTGVFRCRTTFNCTDACPRGIEVTKAIQEVKRAILFERF